MTAQNKPFLAFVAVVPLLLLVSLTHNANATVKVSPAMDHCVRNAVLAYGLLNTGDNEKK